MIKKAIHIQSKLKWLLPIFIGFNVYLFCTSLPKPLFNKSSSTVLSSRENKLLAATISDDGQWYFPPSDSVSEKFKIALVQFEDRRFYKHNGISIKALLRAFVQNIRAKKIVSGGSTIQMQLARMIRGRKGKKLKDKYYEIIMALRLSANYNRETLLEMYAANAPFGGNVIGIDAASWRYFGHPSKHLSWAEASLLAVLPNAPSLMHPGKNRQLLRAKRDRLLEHLYTSGYLSQSDFELAILEELPQKPKKLPQKAPHYLEQAKQRGFKGKRIKSSIKYSYQESLERVVSIHSNRLSQNGIYNACALILDAQTGSVLAYAANSPTSNKHQKDVDMIQARRSTGSILKPFLYAECLNDGYLAPNSLLFDVPTRIGGYAPKNYHRNYQGMVPAKDALSMSLNVPSVLMLQGFGISRFKSTLINYGLSTFNFPSSHYGLSLILGGGEARLFELCQTYSFWVQQLQKKSSKLTDFDKVFLNRTQRTQLDQASIYLTFEAMAEVNRPEEEANWLEFEGGRKVAWKTGTSYGSRDAWAIGVTPKYIIGVWAGNADGEGRPGLTGTISAAPILFQAFNMLPKTGWFEKPNGSFQAFNLCENSGYLKGEFCENSSSTLLPKKAKNLAVCKYHKRIHLDNKSEFRVVSSCYPQYKMNHKNWFVLPPLAEKYYKSRQPAYKELPPWLPMCEPEQELVMQFIYPQKNGEILLPKLPQGQLAKIVFEIAHQDENALVYWHLNQTFLGTTKGLHQLTVRPPKGEQILSVVDENGNRIHRKLTIFESEAQEIEN